MSQKYLIRIAELERLLSEQAEALRQKDQQLSLVEETEAFLRSALARAEEKIEEDEREIEHLRAQIEKLRRMLFGTRSEKLRREVELAEALLKQREQDSDRYSGREDDPQVPRQLRQSRHRRPLPAHLPRESFDLFWCYRRGFWCFALTLITQLFYPSCHCGKADIHSFGGICHRVVLVNNQLSGFAFKLCAEISFFHWSTCVVLR